MKHFKTRALSLLMALATLLSLAATPALAAETADKTLGDGSTSVTIAKGTNLNILNKSTGGTISGSAWTYTSNDGITGPAYCVNWGLGMVSPTKRLEITGRYDRSPKTMGAFANGYPQRTLQQFKELHPNISGIENLTEAEFAYATQLAIWATCGQLVVEGTSFSTGRAKLIKPTSDAQQIRVYESVVEILKLANSWYKQLYAGLYFHMEEEQLGNSVTITDPDGLEGAATKGTSGLKKETIDGREYYTRLMYVDSSTSTYAHDYKILVYSMDAPAGTIFTDAGNTVLTSRSQWGATMYEVPTVAETTSINANGSAYRGSFKLCIPVDSAAESGQISLKAYTVLTQFNLYLAYNPAASEQSYIIADPGYAGKFADASFKWTTTEEDPTFASLQIQKVDGSAMPLEGAEFTLVGDKGTTHTGTSDQNGMVFWIDLPADESYVLTETKAPAGFQVVAPRNITLTAGQTAHITIQDDTEHRLYIKKIDKQNGSTLQGAVFKFEQIDGDYVTTAATGFDGMLEFAGDALPYGSYRISEERAPTGYEKDTSVQTVDWDGTKDVTLTFQNVRQPTIIVSKVDGMTGISLPGASFNIYKDGELVGSGTTDDAGELRFPIVAGEGYYEFEEVAAPAGYRLDSTRRGIHVDPYDPQTKDDPVLTIENFNNPSLRILKYDQTSGTPLPGVTFEIYKDGELFDTLTTDGQGEILLFDIQPGTYLVKEVATDDAHVITSTPQQIELKAGQQETQTLVFFNQLKPGIHLVKVDSQTMASIPNVRFEFKQVGGSFRQEFLTDLNGEIDLSKLEPGAYEVRELEAPEGYLIDDSVRIVQIDPDENANFVFTNTKKPSLVIVKYDPNTGKYLAGATFRIARIEDGTNYLDRVSGTDGRIELFDLEPGVYSVQELEAPAGYVRNETEYHVELFPGKESQLVVNNEAKPDLKIVKTDAITGEPVAGVTFTVKMADGRTITTEATDKNGEILLEDMDPGVVEIWEQSVPNNYLLNEEHQLITLVPNQLATVRFQNYPKPQLIVNKVDSITGEPLKGVKYHVTYASNNTFSGEINDLGYYYSDENGQFTLDKLQDGWYRIEEVESIPGYAIKEPAVQECYIKAGTSKELTFENTPLSALVVWKYDSVTGEAVEGAVFQVKFLGGTSGTGGTVIGTYRTGPSGGFTVTGLQAGTYIVEELSSGPDHVIDSAPQTAYISGEEQAVVQLYFGNSPKGSLLVRKIDSVTHAPLADVEFFVTTADGTVVGDANGKFWTDSAGTFRVEGIEPGTTLVVKEVRAKDGYILDDTPQTARIKAGQTVTLEFRNQPKGGLVVQKIDAITKEPLAGVKFKITTANGELVPDNEGLTSTNGLYTTDENGQIVLSKLQPNTYIVTEVESLPDYVLDAPPQTVVVEEGDTQTLTFTNTPKGCLVIKKIDSVTKEPLSGVQFEIKGCNGCEYPAGTYTTDSNGLIKLSHIPSGCFSITETRAKDGYRLDNTAHIVKVENGACKEVTFENEPLGGLVIKKMDAVTKEPLADVIFKVTGTDGTVVGASNGEYRTDERGFISIPDLAPGGYVVREVRAKSGYLLDDTPKTIEVKDHQTYTLEFFNQPMGGLVVHKLDSVTKAPLEGVQFKITYADGRVVDDEGGKLSSNGLYWTDKNGQIIIDAITGTLVVTEVETIPGYTIHEETRSQAVVVKPDDTQHLYFYNDPIGGVELIKVNADDKTQRIPNTTFEIRRAGDDALVDTVTTDRNGRVFLPLEDDHYYAVEVEAAEGFKLDNTPQYFEVKDGKTTLLTVTNKKFSGVIIHKIDSVTEEGIYGVKFLVYDANKNPIGEYTTDDNGYIYMDELTVQGKGKLYIRELEAAEGYVLDKEYKTVYVQPGKTIEIEWANVPITAQIQLYKYAAEYNSVTGTAPGTPLAGAVYEVIHERSGKVVDYITTDKRGVAAITLPLGRYQLREVTAPAYWQLDPTVHDVTLEFPGQIIKLSAYDKPSNLGVSITKRGNASVLAGSQMRYDFTVANTSNVDLENFYWHDRIPTDMARATVLTTGTYSARLNYRILYKTNYSADYQVLASNLLTSNNYSFALNAIPTQAGEVVTDVYFDFGKVPVGFQSVASPTLTVNVLGNAVNGYQLVNRADVGGKYQGTWQTAQASWVTLVVRYWDNPDLPKTGY